MPRILYKYIDIIGAKWMLGIEKKRKYPNLQYTNASQLNDPFDCHPNLLDFSNIPDSMTHGWIPKEWLREKEEYEAKELRNKTWLCSLSKVHDSLLMWAHYCYNHKGICIGLDVDKILACVPPFFGVMYVEPFVWEVQYQDIIERPDFTKKPWEYQLMTKAKDWEYEQEVRLVMEDPSGMYLTLTEEQQKSRKNIWNWTDQRCYQPLKGDCFASVYLGINIDPKEKELIIKQMQQLNPDIEMYQMGIDETAFRLKAEQIQ